MNIDKKRDKTFFADGSNNSTNIAKSITPETIRQANIEFAKNLSSALLGIVSVAGLGAILLTAPNLLMGIQGASKTLKWFNGDPKHDKRVTKQAFHYLKRKGYISFHSEKKGLVVKLTGQGIERLKKLRSLPDSIKKPNKWNGKWWLVASDVPSKTSRVGGELLRKKLKEMGFYQFQKSLWLYPFDPRSELQHILQYYNLQRFVTLIEVNRLDMQDERAAREYFKKQRLKL